MIWPAIRDPYRRRERSSVASDAAPSPAGLSQVAHKADEKIREPRPRIALLTPYSGGNLGDAAIQDAMIANLRLRLPGARFFGISLNSENFVERHGEGAFPLLATDRRFYGISRVASAKPPATSKTRAQGARHEGRDTWPSQIKRALKRVPGLQQFLTKARAAATIVAREIRHVIGGYCFLRSQNLLVVSGGGQLDEEWGGTWGHPYALFKWAVLARIAGVPYAIVSVGACKVASQTSRIFLAAALGLAQYRSYRDENSRAIAADLMRRAAHDPIVPDLALSLPASELPPPANLRTMAQSRPVIALSPIAYAKPGNWPFQDRAMHDRYVRELAHLVSQLLRLDYFVVIVWSSLGDDESVIPDLLGHLDVDVRNRLVGQLHIPKIVNWRDLVAQLRAVDFLIASRLHATILGFMSETPAIAISFDPKVDWVMEDFGQTAYLLHIRDFTSGEVIETLERLKPRRDAVLKEIAAYQQRQLHVAVRQYDNLVKLLRSSRLMP